MDENGNPQAPPTDPLMIPEVTTQMTKQDKNDLEAFEDIISMPDAPAVQPAQPAQPAQPTYPSSGQAPPSPPAVPPEPVTPQNQAPPPQIQPPYVPPQAPPAGITKDDLASLSDLLRAVSTPEDEEEEEGGQEDEVDEGEYEMVPDDKLKAQFVEAIKRAHPYMDDDDISAMAETQMSMVKPVLQMNMELGKKVLGLEKTVKDLNGDREEVLDKKDKEKVKTYMVSQHPDYDNVEPYIQAFYLANKDLLEQRYSYSRLPRPARAEILYSLVKTHVVGGAQGAQSSTTQAPAPSQIPNQVPNQALGRAVVVSGFPPQSPNSAAPGQQALSPAEQLMKDYAELP